MKLFERNSLETETDSVIDEVISCYMGHKNRAESDIWNCFYQWASEIAEQKVLDKESA